ncbi:hypothetical protein M9458_025144, partial [Cirrhinus mrigala]
WVHSSVAVVIKHREIASPAMSQCVPPIPIRPCVLKYLGKTHNLWLRSTLMLEQQAFEKGLSLHIKPKQSTEFYEQESITPPQQ